MTSTVWALCVQVLAKFPTTPFLANLRMADKPGAISRRGSNRDFKSILYGSIALCHPSADAGTARQRRCLLNQTACSN